MPLRVRSMVGPDPAVRGRGARRRRCSTRLPGFAKRMRVVPRRTAPTWRATSRYVERGARRHGAPPARDPVARAARARAALHARRERVPVAVRHPLAVARARASTRTCSRSTARSTASTTSPASPTPALFGGNSNWRGPVWFPVNYLLIEALERYHHFYGDALKVECPTGSGRMHDARARSRASSSRRLARAVPARRERRAARATATTARYADDPHWQRPRAVPRVLPRRHGRGLGASHQTGWTALVAPLHRGTRQEPLT